MGLVDNAIGLIEENPIATAVGVGVAGAGAGLAVGTLIGSKSKKKTGRKIKHTSRGWKLDRKKFNKSQKWEVAYRRKKRKSKKKSHSRRGIHYTKNGQPYKIMSNGRARFIKRKGRRKN